MSFVSRRIGRPFGEEGMPVKLVYRAEEIGHLRELAAYANAARRTADAVVEEARRAGAELEERFAREEAVRRCQADAALLSRAVALEAAYRARREALIERLEGGLDAALEGALRRIAVEIPAAQRIGIVADELRRRIEPGQAAQLYLSVADEALCRAANVPLPWPLSIDETLAPGTCRLSAEDGEWVLDFDTFVKRFASAA
jgi:flagellar biosynthesis/type III secretory pathway protein FliH